MLVQGFFGFYWRSHGDILLLLLLFSWGGGGGVCPHSIILVSWNPEYPLPENLTSEYRKHIIYLFLGRMWYIYLLWAFHIMIMNSRKLGPRDYIDRAL